MKFERFNESLRIKVLLGVITILLIVFMFPKGEAIIGEVPIGTIWVQADLIAPFSFPIYKDPKIYEKEKLKAADRIKPIFIKNLDIPNSKIDSLRNYSYFLIKNIDDNILQNLQQNRTFLSNESFSFFEDLRKKQNFLMLDDNNLLNQIFLFSQELLSDIYSRGLLSHGSAEIKRDTIALREGKFERSIAIVNFYDKNSAINFIAEELDNKFTLNKNSNLAIIEYLNHFLEPNLIYSEAETKKEIKIAISKVSPNTGIIAENEKIVSKHERVTSEIKSKIDSYKVAKGDDSGIFETISQSVGKFLHILLIIVLLVIYIYLFREKLFKDNYKLLIISIVLLFISFLTFLINQIDAKVPIELLILVPASSMLLTIIFDSRIGFYSTVVIALIVGAIRGNDYSISIIHIIAGALSVFSVRDIRNRNQIFRSFLFVFIGYTSAVLAFSLERYDSINHILVQLIFSSSNALVSPALAYGLVIFFERIFKITTDLTLFELTDFNRPLLKDLARNSPGTFTHSMTIGALVESAAEKIYASPLLARVGAYYHDIGKSLNPAYFVENQSNNQNRHEELPPKESARIIIEHVQLGIQLAKQNNLPKEIIDFIPMHHGTMLVQFFYDKAIEIEGKENVDQVDYRYPGPKPNSKETALLMLADACESTVRSIQEPDLEKIENVINNLIQNRINDGQLDESPLTFNDIKKIKESFIKVLISQHHRRIRYPNQDEMEKNSN